MKRPASIIVKGSNVYLIDGMTTINFWSMRDRFFAIRLIAYAVDNNFSILNIMNTSP